MLVSVSRISIKVYTELPVEDVLFRLHGTLLIEHLFILPVYRSCFELRITQTPFCSCCCCFRCLW